MEDPPVEDPPPMEDPEITETAGGSTISVVPGGGPASVTLPDGGTTITVAPAGGAAVEEATLSGCGAVDQGCCLSVLPLGPGVNLAAGSCNSPATCALDGFTCESAAVCGGIEVGLLCLSVL